MLLFSILTEHSLWFLPLCFLVAALYTTVFYYRDHTFFETNPWINRCMMAFRFLTVALLCFLLLSPFVQSSDNRVEKPLVIVAQDNSESILVNADSIYYKSRYQDDLRQFLARLQQRFTVRTISFGSSLRDSLSFDFSDKSTNFDQLFAQIAYKYSRRNLGAVIVASDGLSTQGTSPDISAEKAHLKCPVYSVALGDTIVPRDARISIIKYNQVGFENNSLPLQMLVEASGLANKKLVVTVREKNNRLVSKEIVIDKDVFHTSIDLVLPPTSVGVHHYVAEITRYDGELNLKNNSREFAIEILKSKQKILVLYHSPHPDLGALRRYLDNSINYTTQFVQSGSFSGKIMDYNLVIMHQLPSENDACTQVLKDIQSNDIPVLFINGMQTDIDKFNAIFAASNRQTRALSYDESQVLFNPSFPLFELDDEVRSFIELCPPLFVPYSSVELENTNVLAYQKINFIDTRRPLIFFSLGSQAKRAAIAGEGMWRWQLTDARKNASFHHFDVLLGKIISYLALKESRAKFRLRHEKILAENQPVEFEAELYNDSYELNNTPEVSMTIINDKGTRFPFVFSKTDKSYWLNAGVFPVGDYTYRAVVAGGKGECSGTITILPLNVEHVNLVADHRAMYALARDNAGTMIFPRGLDSLANVLEHDDTISIISHRDDVLKGFIDIPWLFFLLVLLVSAEWFLRKFNGGY